MIIISLGFILSPVKHMDNDCVISSSAAAMGRQEEIHCTLGKLMLEKGGGCSQGAAGASCSHVENSQRQRGTTSAGGRSVCGAYGPCLVC